MTTSNFDGRVWRTTATVAAGKAEVLRLGVAGPATLAVHALGAGVSAAVDLTLSSADDIAAGAAKWVRAAGFSDAGTVSAGAAMDSIPSSVTAIRVTAAGGTVTVEVLQ